MIVRVPELFKYRCSYLSSNLSVKDQRLHFGNLLVNFLDSPGLGGKCFVTTASRILCRSRDLTILDISSSRCFDSEFVQLSSQS